ncbi:MAG: SufD family Fe-S cluster assembly protein [Candidatus Izemoplasmataceae bacterium]|uniref:SufD family Fe-S cluster assembly protein n=1 Tax=Liberiplasma polymorphum TaxID=3374570 RepID=UPI0037714C82
MCDERSIRKEMMTLPKQLSTLINTLTNVVLVDQTTIKFLQMDETFKSLTIERLPRDAFLEEIRNFDQSHELITVNKNQLENGLVVKVPRKFTSDAILHIFYIGNQDSFTLQTLYQIEPLSNFKLFEYVYSNVKESLNIVTYSDIKENAQFTYTSLSQSDHANANAIIRDAYVHRYGKFLLTNAAFSDALTHQMNHVHLVGDYASATTKTIAVTNKNQEASYHTVVEHEAPFTEGYIEHYGVANDDSTLLFEGVGKIHKNMKRSIAKQSNKGVIIGAKARLDANPLLIIDEFDVEAGHGAAIGQIDEDQLYYLMSRGLTRKDAERLIINGFLAALNNVVGSETLKDYIQLLLNHKTN